MMKQNCSYKTHPIYKCLYVEQFLVVRWLFLQEMNLAANIVLFLTIFQLNEVEEEYLLENYYEG
jgi:protein-S-isoprenylcysteine O-methyltransferase Ste14